MKKDLVPDLQEMYIMQDQTALVNIEPSLFTVYCSQKKENLVFLPYGK